MIALLFGLMYFMFIRPQSKRRKEAESMQKALGAGDKIITIGGLYGTVVGVDDESVTLEISPGVTARYARQAVGRVVSQTTAPTEHVVDNPVQEDK
ncbi:preprotein translocase subunit YajC [Catellatospora tritici]|uniref:preprotein translocase subunit YajC n=1 Tax=Catellatospora tritici TaxID=2851566 RepID=UPI001C2D83EC|nr:preprotein translocase subunit YajC [Catellatospora tritici]MBV1850358.1 preprotein translocase subunit YajC [Catellatospora tritici]